jgi:peroxiredoxin
MPFDVAALADHVVVDPDGDPTRLGDLWAEQPQVVLFLRHFGCVTCRERAGQVRDRYDEILATGAGVTAIGTGGRRYAQAFIEDESVPFAVLLDEDGTAAEIVGTGTLGIGALAKPGAWAAGARSTLGGHRQRKTGRRPRQLGATLVIAPGDDLLYAEFEEYAGDHADIDEILAVLNGIDG